MTYTEIYNEIRAKKHNSFFALDEFELYMQLRDYENTEYSDDFIDEAYMFFQKFYKTLDNTTIDDFTEYLYYRAEDYKVSIKELNFSELAKYFEEE